MKGLIFLLVGFILTFGTANVQTRPCFPSEKNFIKDFYNSVTNCTEDPLRAAKLRSMLADDMVWNSADNVTFLTGDVFTIYTCFPHVGITLDRLNNIRDICEFTLDSDHDVDGNDIEHHVVTKNFLIYNITKDPLRPGRVLNATAFFKESDDFTLVPNPQWSFFNGKPKYLVKRISSYASPREWYLVSGYLPDGFIYTKRSTSLPTFWLYQKPGNIISQSNYTMESFLTLY